VAARRCNYCHGTAEADRGALHVEAWPVSANVLQAVYPAYRHHVPVDVYSAWLPRGCSTCDSRDRLQIDHDHLCCPDTPSCGVCVHGIVCNRHNHLIGCVECGGRNDEDVLFFLVAYAFA
jgi:hypothetical protein